MSPTEFSRYTTRFVGRAINGPAWRYSLAQRLVCQGRVFDEERYDSITRQIVDHLRSLKQKHRRRPCSETQIDIQAALQLGLTTESKLAVEARILAGLTPVEVAGFVGAPTSTVKDYCDIKFDVMDRLDARRWILDRVVGRSPSPLERVVLRDAYLGGPLICEHWLRNVDMLDAEHDLSTDIGRDRRRLWLRVEQEKLLESFPDRMAELLVREPLPTQPVLPKKVGQLISSHGLAVLTQYCESNVVAGEIGCPRGQSATVNVEAHRDSA